VAEIFTMLTIFNGRLIHGLIAIARW